MSWPYWAPKSTTSTSSFAGSSVIRCGRKVIKDYPMPTNNFDYRWFRFWPLF